MLLGLLHWFEFLEAVCVLLTFNCSQIRPWLQSQESVLIYPTQFNIDVETGGFFALQSTPLGAPMPAADGAQIVGEWDEVLAFSAPVDQRPRLAGASRSTCVICMLPFPI